MVDVEQTYGIMALRQSYGIMALRQSTNMELWPYDNLCFFNQKLING